ncbi:hypothetical protein [Phenylobacterium montanum]|uniref:Uncharacterized protein n=1 Tax=Phenylobacterium montanum TaxID=2823693 RepID=A0A975G301_9CAUL|nr:hypothetical protein [Caulobacter sp. S6]QUD90193.1 hypothetical protein KCG34_10160 [Caulobacter sp. S6]
MTTLYAALEDHDASLASLLAALPTPAERLSIRGDETDVSALRRGLEDAEGPLEAFLLIVGAGDASQGLADTDWQAQVLVPLRRAFGLLTGAGRRFRREGRGTIVVVTPSGALGPPEIATPQLVLQRSIIGMTEALRAELQDSAISVGLVFYDSADSSYDGLARRLARALSATRMYSFSGDITRERINAYVGPMLQAIDQATAGAPLPDIGPMGAVYDLALIGAPRR